MYHDSPNLWKSHLDRGLDEDGADYDLTTLAVSQKRTAEREARAVILAKVPGVFVGEGLVAAARLCARERGWNMDVTGRVSNGSKLVPGTEVVEFRGSAPGILALERTFLNLLSFVSGIATITRTMVSRVDEKRLTHPPRVTCTRKTLPGYRELSILGVITGGGVAHRFNLSGGILLKENHLRFAGGVREALALVTKHAPHVFRPEIEVTDIPELQTALEMGSESVMLDNFSPADVTNALEVTSKANRRIWVEVSGGIGFDNILEYAQEGVDVISIGALTHSVRALDYTLLFENHR